MYGIINDRCYGKYLPSNIILYNKIEDNYFDRNQATEININELIHIINISKDKKWYFIKNINYYCWIEKKYVTLLHKNEFNRIIDDTEFITIKRNIYTINGKYLEIGVKLNYLFENRNYYFIGVKRNVFDRYILNIISINKKNATKGYLQFSKINFLKQLKNYLGTSYGWGGLHNGVDCSGLICNTFKTFGIYVPRDTSKQCKVLGDIIIDVKEASLYKKRKLLLNNKYLIIVYLNGHVMVIYKVINKIIYVIHASSNHKKVIIEVLEDIIINNIQYIHYIK